MKRKLLFLTGPQDNRNKDKRKKIILKSYVRKLLLDSQKRPGSGSANRINAGSGSH
jgi:hypothetical protein